jgi:uncharacterized protein with NRDE domain
MCLIIFAYRMDAAHPLLVAANRDEFYARPSQASEFWREHPSLLAGRDLEAGGTWMGVTRAGRFAAITNFRDPAATLPAPRSRGELPVDFLAGSTAPHDYLRQVAERAHEYAGFNLLLGDGQTLLYFCNSRSAGRTGDAPRLLPPGIYGLSNARLDTPWPKVELGKRRLARCLARGATGHDRLAETVADTALADAAALRDQGVDSGMERLLSAQFIRAGSYGTRACTTLRLGANEIDWCERTYDQDGVPAGEQRFRFPIDA